MLFGMMLKSVLLLLAAVMLAVPAYSQDNAPDEVGSLIGNDEAAKPAPAAAPAKLEAPKSDAIEAPPDLDIEQSRQFWRLVSELRAAEVKALRAQKEFETATSALRVFAVALAGGKPCELGLGPQGDAAWVCKGKAE